MHEKVKKNKKKISFKVEVIKEKSTALFSL
jgi:hypothetical protein